MSTGTIGLTELRVGVPFPTVPLEIMRHAAGPVASSLALTGQPVSAAEAHRLGLVDAVLPPQDLLDAAVARASALAAIPADAFALTKQQLHAPARHRIDANRAKDDAAALELWQRPATLRAMVSYLDQLRTRAQR